MSDELFRSLLRNGEAETFARRGAVEFLRLNYLKALRVDDPNPDDIPLTSSSTRQRLHIEKQLREVMEWTPIDAELEAAADCFSQSARRFEYLEIRQLILERCQEAEEFARSLMLSDTQESYRTFLLNEIERIRAREYQDSKAPKLGKKMSGTEYKAAKIKELVDKWFKQRNDEIESAENTEAQREALSAILDAIDTPASPNVPLSARLRNILEQSIERAKTWRSAVISRQIEL